MLLLLSAVIVIVAARSAAWLLPTLGVCALLAALVERTPLRNLTQVAPATVLIVAFIGLAALSAAWSADPWYTLAYAVMVLFLLIQWQILIAWIAAQPMRRVNHLAYWLAIATLIGLAILTLEVSAQQFFRRYMIETFDILTPPTLGRHYQIDSAGNVRIFGFELNRSIAAANMMLWPAFLCAASYWSDRKLALMGTVLVTCVIVATFAANHETSKIAIIAGVLTFALARYSPRFAFKALATGWVLLFIAVVPATLVAHGWLKWDTAPWLQHSAQQRIIIWGDMSERVIQAPFIGVGARTAYVLSDKAVPVIEGPSSARTGYRAHIAAKHAHNVYLQTWYELGLVGVILLVAAGLVTLQATMRYVVPEAQPYVFATFVTFMAQIGSSWEIWQRWFFALFALSAAAVILGLRAFQGDPDSDPTPPPTP